MNRVTRIVVLGAAALIAAGTFTLFLTLDDLNAAAGQDTPYESEQAVHVSADSVSLEEEQYFLRIYDGNIAVYYGAFQDQPAIVTEIKVNSLREADRQLLNQGIQVKTYEEVLKLLEDFGS